MSRNAAAASFEAFTHVATVRATRKGEKLSLSTGTEIGGVGVDGRQWHRIEKAGVGQWRCDCMDFRFRGAKRPCKHLLVLWDGARSLKLHGNLIQGEIVRTDDIIVTKPEAFFLPEES